MNSYVRLTVTLAVLCAALSTASLASSMYFVQGIPGRDYAAATDPAFPLDILLNDEVCYVHGLPYGAIQGPLTFLPGTYNVKVSIANSLAPCTNSPLIDREVTIEPKTDISAVLALNEAGTPTLLTFTNDLSPVTTGMARVLFAQAAGAPAVQVILQNTTTKKLYTYSVKPDTLLEADLSAGNYTVEINQGTTNLVPSTFLSLDSQSVDLLYAVGQVANNTVALATRALKNVT
jgi:hypothetical protein